MWLVHIFTIFSLSSLSYLMNSLARPVELPCQTCPTCPISLRTSKKWYIFFLFSRRKHIIYCGYSLEVPRWGTSNEYPQHMFSSRNKKKCQYLGKLILVGQVDFDHLLVCGQVIKFDISTTLSYHTSPKSWRGQFYYLFMYLQSACWIANSVDPDHLIWVYSVCLSLSVQILY